jgi:hypothetical protein
VLHFSTTQLHEVGVLISEDAQPYAMKWLNTKRNLALKTFCVYLSVPLHSECHSIIISVVIYVATHNTVQTKEMHASCKIFLIQQKKVTFMMTAEIH